MSEEAWKSRVSSPFYMALQVELNKEYMRLLAEMDNKTPSAVKAKNRLMDILAMDRIKVSTAKGDDFMVHSLSCLRPNSFLSRYSRHG